MPVSSASATVTVFGDEFILRRTEVLLLHNIAQDAVRAPPPRGATKCMRRVPCMWQRGCRDESNETDCSSAQAELENQELGAGMNFPVVGY